MTGTPKHNLLYGYKIQSSGFTLLELTVVLAIMGFLVMIMSPVFSNETDQNRYEKTLAQMEEIRKALVGGPSEFLNGQRQFSGYIYDMGGLPVLTDVLGTPGDAGDDQPHGLWRQGSLPDWAYDATSRIRAGWRGPYIETPAGGVLRDGWGNPFVFTMAEQDLTIESYGADGVKDTGAEAGFDEDVILTLKETEYLAPMAGRVIGYPSGNNGNIRVRIYSADMGSVNALTLEVGLPEDGFFRFEPRDPATEPETEQNNSGRKYAAIPAGIRSIVAYDVTDPPPSPSPIVLTLEPSGNWIGEIKIQ